jgi:iron complex outermembrane receptor protein
MGVAMMQTGNAKGTGRGLRRDDAMVGIGAVSILALLVATAAQATPRQQALPRLVERAPLPPKRDAALPAAPQAGTLGYSVPAGALAPALTRWADISGLKLLAQSEALKGLTTPGLAGAFTPEAALGKLLDGSDLVWRWSDAGTVAITSAAYAQLGGAGQPTIALDTIQVQGISPTATIGPPPAPYAGGQVGSGARVGLLGNRNVFNTPFNVTGYTEKSIEDQQARSLADVTANDPSVRTLLSRGTLGEQFFIRGLRVFPDDVGFDGLYGITSFRRQPIEAIERVEILKGPSALLLGTPPSGSVGGAINLIPKRAPNEDVNRVTTTYASKSQIGTHVDLSRRFGANKEWGVRFNGVYRDGEIAVDRNEIAFGAAALGLDYRGDRVRLSADLGYHQQDINGIQDLQFVGAGVRVPRAPNGAVNASQPWQFGDFRHALGAFRAEFDVTDQTTVYAAYGRFASKETTFNGSLNIINQRGDFLQQTGIFPGRRNGQTAEIGLRSRFETGPILHQLTLTAVGLHRENGGGSTNFGTPISGNIYSFQAQPERSIFGRSRARPTTSINQNRGIALADTLSILDERIALTIGGRLQQISTNNYAPSGARTSQYDEQKLTPAVGLVVKPLAGLSLYANYIEGLQAGAIAPVTAVNAGEALAPFVSRQVEAGAKYDFGSFGASLSAFQIVQPSSFTNPATNRFSADGEQRNRGVELNVFGEPLPGLRLLGGVALTDSELTKTVGNINNGKTAPGVPATQINLYAEYDLPFAVARGLTLTGRLITTSSQFLDQGNTQKIPNWTRVDLGLRYVWQRADGKPVTLRAAVENVFDKNYYASAAGGFLTLGSPRTYLVSAAVDF